jgi:hypothetical protein
MERTIIDGRRLSRDRTKYFMNENTTYAKVTFDDIPRAILSPMLRNMSANTQHRDDSKEKIKTRLMLVLSNNDQQPSFRRTILLKHEFTAATQSLRYRSI